MYKVKDTIAYSSQGVCVIEEISTRDVGGKAVDYYVLKPVFDTRSTVYVPVGNERLTARMRQVLTGQEASRLIAALPEAEDLWTDDDNRRGDCFRAILTDGEPAMLAALYKTLVGRRRVLEENQRKLRSSDEAFLKQAEKLLSTECSFAEGCEPDAVRERMLARLS